ncbi:hypothetical protein IWX49DRAFT_232252 [Phyllosticta citricarpa]|uniref:Rhodopsin domain-containing protein n=1 Tax=Phyllosticta citricarpa TaxID=55181 RepID=A0ABR1LVK3_9PEZI
MSKSGLRGCRSRTVSQEFGVGGRWATPGVGRAIRPLNWPSAVCQSLEWSKRTLFSSMVDQSRLFIHFGLMTPLGVLSTMMVALRFYTRLAITRMHLAADDYLILVAMFLSNASSIMVAVADFAFDEGQALGNSPSDIQKKIGMRKIHWVATQMYPIMSFTLKISILLLYRRIFFVVPTFTRVCNVLIILISALHLAGFSSGIFLCVPISYFWEQVLPPGAPGAPMHKGRCQNYQVAWLVLGSFNVLTDLITVVLPLPVLGRLKITAQRRAFLVFIFTLSSVPVIASLLRIQPLVRIPGGNDDPLFSQHVWELQLYCGIEISVGITCACLPTLTPLAVRLFPKLMGSQGGNGSEPVGPFGAALGGLAKVLNGKRASGDAALHAESRGEDFDPVTTIGGTSAKLPGFVMGRKGSVRKGRSGRKHSSAETGITTITADETMTTKTIKTVVPVDEKDVVVEEQTPATPASPKSKQNDRHHDGHKHNNKTPHSTTTAAAAAAAAAETRDLETKPATPAQP